MDEIRKKTIIRYIGDEVFLSFQKGESWTFKIYFEAFHSKVVYFAYNILKNLCDAEDIANESFEKLFINYDKIKDRDHVGAFLFQITRNACLNFKRDGQTSKKKDKRFIAETFDEIGDLYEPDELKMLQLKKAIEELPKKAGKVLKCLYFEGMSHKSAAVELNVRQTTIKSSIIYALLKLRESMSVKKTE